MDWPNPQYAVFLPSLIKQVKNGNEEDFVPESSDLILFSWSEGVMG